MGRFATVERTTKESDVRVELDLDGTGVAEISTGVPFYDHMLTALAKHSASTSPCAHDRATSTSTATTRSRTPRLALGEALRQALGDKAGIRRFGDALVPLDEALAQAVVDISGRPYLVHGEPALGAPDRHLLHRR